MAETNNDPLSILPQEELQWFGEWLSEQQITEAIQREFLENPGCPHSVIFNVLEAMRSRVEDGLPPVGNLWENPSEEETRKSIEALNRRLTSYND